MSLLGDVSSNVQQVADAISIAIGVEVEIVDNELTIIAGSSMYSSKVGQKEEAGKVDGNFLYARVLRTGNTEFIADVDKYKYYGVSFVKDKERELAEICTPIKVNGRIIGIIGLIAKNEEQRNILLDKERRMTSFVEKMADLLAAKAENQALLTDSEISRDEMATILESAHEGIFAIDKNGYIKHCNKISEQLFNEKKSDMVESHISKYMMRAPALEVLKTGVGYTEHEEIYKTYKGTYHLIVSANPYFKDGKVDGVVISLRDMNEARKLAYNINTGDLKYTFDDIVGESEAINKIKTQAAITARGDSTVLISGESGTGKEIFAKAIHYSGIRDGAPFVTVNCGAIPENLLESELFGYVEGAFTGAIENGKQGKFEIADKGTIFLDEIGDMPIHLQVKILHVLQNKRFERVGGNKTILVDVRVIAATNKDLESMIESGEFREDLYYRLSVIPLNIPALRERREDIERLMEFFLNKYNGFMGKDIQGFSNEVKDIYRAYDWPGNVRELENAVEYGVNMAYGNVIGVDAVPDRVHKQDSTQTAIADDTATLNKKVKNFEKDVIVNILKKYGNSSNAKDEAAKELGLSRATLYRKLADLDIN